jgi:hypothetical protein
MKRCHKTKIVLAIAALATVGSCEQQTSSVTGPGVDHVVKCSQPLPEFTLGPNSTPTAQQEAALCSCVWERLGRWERRTAQQLSQGKESEVSSLNMRAFPYRFGAAVEACGGMKL